MNIDEAIHLGTGLRRIDPALLKHGHTSVWFKGAEPYFDVFLELAPTTGAIEWFQVTLRGRSVTWRSGQPLQTGTTSERQLNAGAPQSTTIIVDACINAEFVKVVHALLGAQHEQLLLRSAHNLLG